MGRSKLAEKGFFTLAADLCREQATGVLEITSSVGVHRAFFLNGVPQGARLARLLNPLGQMLIAEGIVAPETLEVALAEHNRTDKLIGQILLEMGAVTDEGIQRGMQAQSRANFAALFGDTEGEAEFLEGLVQLVDFTPASTPPLLMMYVGGRDFSPENAFAPFLAQVALTSIRGVGGMMAAAQDLGPAEIEVLGLLGQFRLIGDIARRGLLPPRALAALLAALHALGMLEIGPAERARVDTMPGF